MSKRFKLNVLLYIVLVVMLFSPAYVAYKAHKDKEVDFILQSSKEEADVAYRSALYTYVLVSNTVYDNVINKPRVLSIIEKALDASPLEQQKLRSRLHTMLSPLYTNLKKQHIRQLHFHLKDSVSFLRFHKPSKFGDSLKNIRYSLDKVNETKQAVFGFEEGRIYNGFRNVYPLFYHDAFIGTVEISYSFKAVEVEAKKSINAEYDFLLSKRVVDNKVWVKKGNYKTSSLNKDFMRDENLGNKSLDYRTKIDKINQQFTLKQKQALASIKIHQYITKLDDEYYVSTFLPIKNVEKQKVGYIVTYKKVKEITYIYEIFFFKIVVSLLLSMFFSLVILLYRDTLVQAKKQLEISSTTDNLTKIANRNALQVHLVKLLKLQQRYRSDVSVIFFDIDYFKHINDTYGHSIGDKILKEVAVVVSQNIRETDFFARWGGEEFIITLTGTALAEAKLLAEKLRLTIESHTFIKNIKVTCSFGVTQVVVGDDDSTLIKRVDKALYSAKESGRNTVTEI